MKKLLAIFACLLVLGLSACSSGNDSKQNSSDADKPPKKSVFDSYIKDVNKAKQVQGKLDAAQQKENAELQQAVSAGTSSTPQSANDSGGN